MLKLLVIPDDVACTSKEQTWHKPRGDKIQGQEVQTLQVKGHSKRKKSDDSDQTKFIKTTLYNPLRGKQLDYQGFRIAMSEKCPDFMINPALNQMSRIPVISSKYGSVAKGSALAVQQRLQEEYVLNLYDGVTFPHLPIENRMYNDFSFVPTQRQLGLLQQISVSSIQIKAFEEKTREQGKSLLWHKLRKHRLTASRIGEIVKRKSNFETLVKRLKSTRSVCTAAMRHGICSKKIFDKPIVL